MFSKIKMSAQNFWDSLPENWRVHVISAFHTFVSTFATELLAMLATSTDLSLSRMTLFGALNVAIRATLKSSIKIQK